MKLELASDPEAAASSSAEADGASQKAKPIVFRASTMSSLEMLYEMNRILLPLVVQKEEVVMETKAAKLMASGKKR